MEVREAESAFAEGGFAGGQRQRLSPAVAIEELIDDERHSDAFGLMMSLNTLIEFSDAFDFTPETSTDGVGRSFSPDRGDPAPRPRVQPSGTSEQKW